MWVSSLYLSEEDFPQMFYRGFMSGLDVYRSRTTTRERSRKAHTLCALRQRTLSYCKTKSLPLTIKCCCWGEHEVSEHSMYWSCRMVPSHWYTWPTPSPDMHLQITWEPLPCLTVGTMHWDRLSVPVHWTQSYVTPLVDCPQHGNCSPLDFHQHQCSGARLGINVTIRWHHGHL